jgi:hypothetical protein
MLCLGKCSPTDPIESALGQASVLLRAFPQRFDRNGQRNTSETLSALSHASQPILLEM